MDEQKEYAEMLEIPVNTCNITVKKSKPKKKKKNLEEVKEELINKINTEEQSITEDDSDKDFSTATVTVKKKSDKKRKFKVTPVGVGITLVIALFITIAVTNSIMPSSGINNFFRSVFGGEAITSQVDLREYSDFDVNIPYEGASVNSGVLTVNKESSLYATCDGIVESVSRDENGKFNMLIRHNDNFSTLISGMNYAYFNDGDRVYKTLPVGYTTSGGATVCFLDKDNSVIVNFKLSGNAVVWEA